MSTTTEEQIEIGCVKHSKYDKIFLLNGLTLSEDKPFFKYISYNRLLDYVNSKSITFVSPAMWIDPFERIFWHTCFTKYNYTRPEIACMCVTIKSVTNEEAAWKMYTDSKVKALRVSLCKDRLYSILQSYAQKNECKIYIGKVIYKYNRQQIEKLHKSNNEFFPDTTQFTDCHYLTLMCLKRKAFAFENEIRIFIVKDKLDWEGNLLKIPTNIDKNIIPRIVIGPHPPFENSDPCHILYQEIQKMESSVYKKELSRLIPGCNLIQSQLYIPKAPLVVL